jgi:hypothetical protein
MPPDTGAHNILRERLPVDVLGALIAAIVYNQRGDPIRSVYTLIAVAEVMAKHLPPVDQMLAALEMHQTAIDLLPPEPRIAVSRHIKCGDHAAG